MESALFAMVAALFIAVLGGIYEQRREGAKTRNKLDENNEALRELAARTMVLEGQPPAPARGVRGTAAGLRGTPARHRQEPR